MRAAVCSLAVAAACYSPRAGTGAPCSPELDNCPGAQTCALVGGGYVCVDGPVPDGPVIRDAPAIDTPPLSDAFVPRDTPADAAAPPWVLVQTKGSQSASVTLAATGAGHLLVVAIETNATDPVTAVADSANDTFAALPSARATNSAANLGVELWAASNAQAGATAVTVIAPVVHAVVVWEVANVRTAGALDKVTLLDDQPATTLPAGAAITTAAPGEFVVSVAIVANQVSGIHAGNEFTNDHTTFGNGWAHLTDPAAPAGSHQAKWDQGTAGAYCAVSAAFLIGP
ncbi:MAG: hypothetical protein ACM31C_22860 [Acidobacteriota bacterium]